MRRCQMNVVGNNNDDDNSNDVNSSSKVKKWSEPSTKHLVKKFYLTDIEMNLFLSFLQASFFTYLFQGKKFVF